MDRVRLRATALLGGFFATAGLLAVAWLQFGVVAAFQDPIRIRLAVDVTCEDPVHARVTALSDSTLVVWIAPVDEAPVRQCLVPSGWSASVGRGDAAQVFEPKPDEETTTGS